MKPAVVQNRFYDQVYFFSFFSFLLSLFLHRSLYLCLFLYLLLIFILSFSRDSMCLFVNFFKARRSCISRFGHSQRIRMSCGIQRSSSLSFHLLLSPHPTLSSSPSSFVHLAYFCNIGPRDRETREGGGRAGVLLLHDLPRGRVSIERNYKRSPHEGRSTSFGGTCYTL